MGQVSLLSVSVLLRQENSVISSSVVPSGFGHFKENSFVFQPRFSRSEVFFGEEQCGARPNLDRSGHKSIFLFVCNINTQLLLLFMKDKQIGADSFQKIYGFFSTLSQFGIKRLESFIRPMM